MVWNGYISTFHRIYKNSCRCNFVCDVRSGQFGGGDLLKCSFSAGLAAPAIAHGLGALAPTLGSLVPSVGASGFAAAATATGTDAGAVAVAASFGGIDDIS